MALLAHDGSYRIIMAPEARDRYEWVWIGNDGS
jgi:hypothetical protein